MSLALFCEEHFQIAVDLKWPNDLYSRGKKCGGILLKNQQQRMLIGVGLNLLPNSDWGSVLPSSTILPEDFSRTLPQRFVASYLGQRSLSPEVIARTWNERCVHLNKQVTIQDGEKVVTGTFHGLGPHGEALVGTEKVYNGTLRWD